MPEDQEDWTQQYGPSWADHMLAADPTLLDEIQKWWEETSPEPMVGSRHHTVPRFYLERFALNDQLWVRDRVTGRGRLESISSTGAIRDFYTFINADGEKDGRLETILSSVESGAKEIFDRLLSPFHPPRPLDEIESVKLALFLTFQLLRTPRHRREMELLGDYVGRTSNRNVPGIEDVRLVPDPNFHLGFMTKVAPKLSESLMGRPATLITIDEPIFFTGDEPVILVTLGDQSHVRHLASCRKTTRTRQKNAKKLHRTRSRNADTIHAYPTRPGIAQAAEIGLTLTPRTLLVLGPPGERLPNRIALQGAPGSELAENVNSRLIDQAYGWLAAHPEHPTFRQLAFPEPGPIVQVCDGGSKMARDLNRAPSPRRPSLLGRS